MFDKRNILKNISKPDEKLFFSKAFDRAYYCIKKFVPTFTEFTDPYKISSLLSLMGSNYDFNIRVFGGFDNCERQKIGFFPDFMSEKDFLFPISVIKITYNSKFSRKLTHRDFLGSLLGLGIVRGKIGDILIKESSIFVFVDEDIADFIVNNLIKVGNTNVNVKIVSSDEVEFYDDSNNIKNIVLTSLRLDNLLSGAFNLSRGRVSDFIKSQKVFINWNICEVPSKQISENDVITLRGFGRVKIVELIGKTKKGKFLVSIFKFS